MGPSIKLQMISFTFIKELKMDTVGGGVRSQEELAYFPHLGEGLCLTDRTPEKKSESVVIHARSSPSGRNRGG